MKRASLLFLALLSVTFPCFSQWNARATMTNPRGQHGAIAHPNGNIYVWGGFVNANVFTDMEIYNEATNTWSTGAPIPVGTRGQAFALGNDNNIYSFGGFDAGHLNISHRYNVSLNTWTSLAPVPIAVWEGTAAKAPNGNMIIFGGENAMNLVQIYNPVTDTWSSGANLPIASRMHSAITDSNGLIYIIGGWTGSVALSDVQIYDPVMNSWSTGTPMPTPRNQFGSTLGVDGNIYIIGGKVSGGNNSGPFFTTAEVYHVATDSWTVYTALPIGTGEAESVTINNGIHLIGGTTTAYVNSNLRIDTPLGLEEPLFSGINIYPNPVSDVLNLEITLAEASAFTLQITDLAGKVVLKETHNSGAVFKASLNVKALPSGAYLLSLSTPSEKIVKRFVVE